MDCNRVVIVMIFIISHIYSTVLSIEVKVKVLVTQLCPTLCDSMEPTRLFYPWGFSRQEYWSGLPCPPPGDHPDPDIEPKSLTSPALAGRFYTTSTIWEALNHPH